MGFDSGGLSSGSALKRAKGPLDTAPMVPCRPADDTHLIGGFNMFQAIKKKSGKNLLDMYNNNYHSLIMHILDDR